MSLGLLLGCSDATATNEAATEGTGTQTGTDQTGSDTGVPDTGGTGTTGTATTTGATTGGEECVGPGEPPWVPADPILRPAMRGASTLGLAGDDDITNRTGENPTVSTWDGKVIVRRCPDPDGVVYHEAPVGNQPGVLELQYWCFSAIRPSLVTVDAAGVPDFSNAFGPEYVSTDRHVSHSGGFPIVENQDPDARFNPYPSTIDGAACGVASLEPTPPPCPAQRYATYDAYIVHTVGGSNPETILEYPDWPAGGGAPTFFERMLIVVEDPETPAARVVDVIRESTPYPMVADPNGFGFVYDENDPSTRNPHLFRETGEPSPTYVGGPGTLEPAATNDGRMVVFNGGDENPDGVNLIYTWNPEPAAQTGWSPPKNVAYMYWVEGPGSPDGETMITIDGVPRPFSDVFPIAKHPLVDQQGVPYDPGSTYVPAQQNPDGPAPPYVFGDAISEQHYLGAYPWLSWDGRHIMSLSNGRFNVTVIGDMTGYQRYYIDGGIDRTDLVGNNVHEISAMWTLGQWPGRWAQYANELEGIERTIPTRTRDAVTWAIFEQDHYSEISFHKIDGSYALYFPMSRMGERGSALPYLDDLTPDVSRNFDTGTLVAAGGSVGFSQSFATGTYVADPEQSDSFGFSGQSVGFLTEAANASIQPHIVAAPVAGIEGALTVEGAVYLRTGGSLPTNPWTSIIHQPGSFSMGVDAMQQGWFEVIDVDGAPTRVTTGGLVPEDAWVHLTGVYDGAELRLYVDGALVAATPGTGLPVNAASGDIAVGPANLGTDPGGNGLVFIDEVGVTAGVRSAEQIAHSAFQRISWPTTSLADWESLWGAGSMPLGLSDPNGAPLAPIHLGFEVEGETDSKVGLGERLFRDSALSTTNPPISCESCHGLTMVDGGARTGETVSMQGAGMLSRHTPTVYNRVFGTRQFWDGRAVSLGEQIPVPIESPVEMNMPLDQLIDTVLPAVGYEPDFCAAFGDSTITLDRMKEAISYFESGLVSGNSAIDRHRLLGDALSESEQRGLALFETKARCIGCHPPPLYTDERFHDNGQGNDADAGQAAATGLPSDYGRFRTMSLRDVDRTPPYMHDGSVETLHDVLELYNAGGDDDNEIEMRPLRLSPEEIADLEAFLQALRSETFVVPLR